MEEQANQPVREQAEEPKAPMKETLVGTPEGRILLAGGLLLFGYLLWLGLILIYSPEQSHVLVGMTATEILFGRAAAMAFGYSLGLRHGMVITLCIFLETILVLLFYPLFVFSFRHLLQIRWLRRTFDRVQKAAEIHKGKVERYGVIGLFAFVWFPFWMTGPVVGCVIGFLLGLRIRVNLTAVLAGTYTAIFGWALFMKMIHEHAASTSTYTTGILVVLLLILILVGRSLHKTLSGNRKKK